MWYLIGLIVIVIGMIFVSIGTFGVNRFKNFYYRALVAAQIDTVGYSVLLCGVMIQNGFSFFTLKVLFILIITLIINPLVTHSVTRSAFYSGYKIGRE